MTELQRVKRWLRTAGDSNGWQLNVIDDRYYGFTFDSDDSATWEGMFWPWNDDYLNENYAHILDLDTGKLVK